MARYPSLPWFIALFVSLLAAADAVAVSVDEPAHLQRRTSSQRPHFQNGHWVTTWGAMPQLTEPYNLPSAPFNETGRVFFNSTIRQTLRTSIGADQIRLRLSNAFGGSDLPVTKVTIALPEAGLEHGGTGSSLIEPKTLQTVTFSGSENYTIPNGALIVSDPLDFKIKPESILTVSIYLAEGQTTNSITSHPGSRTTSWFAFGDHVEAKNITDPSTMSAAHWFFISDVEAWAPKSSSAFIIVGDSITDGHASTDNADNRWPDVLLDRMQKDSFTRNIGMVNQAAGGNRILRDSLGPNALGRIGRDVLAQSGLKYAMIFEGVNDIGTADTTEEAQTAVGDSLIAAFQQMVTEIHTFGVPVFGATITPFMGNSTIQPYSDPTREVTRKRVNDWIRKSGVFDAVIDFDKVVADPENPSQLNPKYDSGDFLHPSVAGYAKMAESVPLSLFTRFEHGVSGWM